MDLALLRQIRDQAAFFIGLDGRCASWNEGVGSVLGWTEAQWLGQPSRAAFTPEDAAAGVPEEELRTAAANGCSDDDRWMMRRDGSRFFASGSVNRIDDASGLPVGYVKILRDATKLRQAEDERNSLLGSEQAARAQAERQAAVLTAAIEAIPDGVYIGDETGITRCNRTALDMLGAMSLQDLHARAETLGERFRVRLERDGPLARPQDLPFARALGGETSVLDTWATQLSTGVDVYIRGTAAPIVVDGRIVGAVAVNSDLTDRLKIERQREALNRAATDIRERDEQLRAVFAGVRDYAIFTVDPGGCISSWHEGAARIKGYSAEEAIGMPFSRLFTPEDRAAGLPRHEMEIAARTGEYKGEGTRLRKNGELFEADVVLTALRGPDGELLGFLKLTRDITERRRRERERDELLRITEVARRDAEHASQSKNEFLATISHELRTPLGAILGWAHVLQRGLVDARGQEQALAAITRNANAQVQLIEDLLDMSRIESGQLRLDLQPVELAGVIARAVDAVLPTADARGVRLHTVLDPAACAVNADASRMQQIVWNLLTNAVKFTPAGGSVAVALDRVTEDAVEIAVADDGQGIQPEFLPHVFERFRQQDGTTTRRYGGLGLGLAIVRQLAELHGGSVRAESRGVGHGARFVVRLPVPARAQGAGSQPERMTPQRSTVRLDGISVLLVDDEPDGRAMAAHVLRSAGALVLDAGSAEEGYALFRERRPQAILSDLGMPVNDGYDFIRWIRDLEAKEGGRTPAAAFTAYAHSEDAKRALAAGFQKHLVKPLEPDRLVEAVAALVGAGVAYPLDGTTMDR